MTLTEFLLARIAEDEHAAECERELIDVRPLGMKPAHLAFAPARVLAECEAKRRIVADHQAGPAGDCNECSRFDAPCPTIRYLAAVYADHPDYDEAWRP